MSVGHRQNKKREKLFFASIGFTLAAPIVCGFLFNYVSILVYKERYVKSSPKFRYNLGEDSIVNYLKYLARAILCSFKVLLKIVLPSTPDK